MRGDMDHVVLGKTGVFVVETKCWDGEVTCEHERIWVDRRLPTRDPLAQVLESRDALERLLAETKKTAVKVRAVVCFAGYGFQGQRARANGVEVCHARELVSLLEAPGETALTPDEIKAVADKLAKLL